MLNPYGCPWRHNAEASRAAFHGDWFRSGDLGHTDGEGYFYVDDRKKDMITSGGENIHPAEGSGKSLAELMVGKEPEYDISGFAFGRYR